MLIHIQFLGAGVQSAATPKSKKPQQQRAKENVFTKKLDPVRWLREEVDLSLYTVILILVGFG